MAYYPILYMALACTEINDSYTVEKAVLYLPFAT